ESGPGALPRAACSRCVARWTTGEAVTGFDNLRTRASVPHCVSAWPARLAAACITAAMAARRARAIAENLAVDLGQATNGAEDSLTHDRWRLFGSVPNSDPAPS